MKNLNFFSPRLKIKNPNRKEQTGVEGKRQQRKRKQKGNTKKTTARGKSLDRAREEKRNEPKGRKDQRKCASLYVSADTEKETRQPESTRE